MAAFEASFMLLIWLAENVHFCVLLQHFSELSSVKLRFLLLSPKESSLKNKDVHGFM